MNLTVPNKKIRRDTLSLGEKRNGTKNVYRFAQTFKCRRFSTVPTECFLFDCRLFLIYLIFYKHFRSRNCYRFTCVWVNKWSLQYS